MGTNWYPRLNGESIANAIMMTRATGEPGLKRLKKKRYERTTKQRTEHENLKEDTKSNE